MAKSDLETAGQLGLAAATGGVSLLFSKQFRRGVGRFFRGGDAFSDTAAAAGTGGAMAGVEAFGRVQAAWQKAQADYNTMNFDALDELNNAMAQYSYSASRNAYAPFFSKAGRRGSGERTHTGYTGPTADVWSGSAPTPGSTQSPYGFRTPGAHRGMVQALGASQSRAKQPGSLAPRV